MATWIEDIVKAFYNLNGVCHLTDLYDEVENIRMTPLPQTWQATIRGAIETHSSDSNAFLGNKDLFFSVQGLGNGIWGLRNFKEQLSQADINLPERIDTSITRVIRDTKLSNSLKRLHNYKCQICGHSIKLKNGKYAEAHHIRPLSRIHNGPDIAENIIILCPNHHVLCDYGVISLNLQKIIQIKYHKIGIEYIAYHNERICANRYI